MSGIYLLCGRTAKANRLYYYIGESADVTSRFRSHQNYNQSRLLHLRGVLLQSFDGARDDRWMLEQRFIQAAKHLKLSLTNRSLPKIRIADSLTVEQTLLKEAVEYFAALNIEEWKFAPAPPRRKKDKPKPVQQIAPPIPLVTPEQIAKELHTNADEVRKVVKSGALGIDYIQLSRNLVRFEKADADLLIHRWNERLQAAPPPTAEIQAAA
jgi:hypothetical protein